MNTRREAMLNIPFCRRSWRLLAVVLVMAYVATFSWGIHLFRDASRLEREAASAQVASPAPPGQLPEGLEPIGELVGEAVLMPAGGLTALPVVGLSALEQSAVVNIAGKAATSPAGSPEGALLSVGSGVLITPDGNVVTAWHLVKDLHRIQVRLLGADGPKQYSAEVVKQLPDLDLAVLKLTSRDAFPYLTLEDAPRVRVGEWVATLGNPLGTGWIEGVGSLVETEATLAIAGQRLQGLLRSGASTHGSQSGGPLLNVHGRMVGLNLVILDGNGGMSGYAVPSWVIRRHFRDVVNFPESRPPGVAGVPAAPDAGSSVPGRRGRADVWWQQARAKLAQEGAENPGGVVPKGADPVWVPVAGAAPAGAVPLLEWELWGYSLTTITGLLLLGLISGISGGMMTMGGGILKVSGLMLFFGYGMVLVRPVAYLTNIFLYGAASLRYQRLRLIRWESVRPLMPWAMTGIVIGFFAGIFMGNTLIRYLLGLFAMLVGIKMLAEIVEQQRYGDVEDERETEGSEQSDITELFLRYLGVREIPLHRRPRSLHPLVQNGLLGLPLGVISGILGITGGVVEVPLQRYVAGEPLRNAIANSAILVFCASLVGSVVALFYGIQTGAFDWKVPIVLSVFLIPGAYLGGWIGAWLTHVVPVLVLRWIYALLMFVIAARMIWA